MFRNRFAKPAILGIATLDKPSVPAAHRSLPRAHLDTVVEHLRQFLQPRCLVPPTMVSSEPQGHRSLPGVSVDCAIYSKRCSD